MLLLHVFSIRVIEWLPVLDSAVHSVYGACLS